MLIPAAFEDFSYCIGVQHAVLRVRNLNRVEKARPKKFTVNLHFEDC